MIEPTDKELRPDPSGEIRIQQIRDLQKTINLKPYQSKHRVAVLIRFQEANPNASNALLKLFRGVKC
jgi:hypothetical protein